MKKNPKQLEFEFDRKDMMLSNRFECEHNFYTESFTDHEVCDRCGLCVPHEYILESVGLENWPEDGV